MARIVKSIKSGLGDTTGLGETAGDDQLEGRYSVEVATLTDSATITADFEANQNFTVTLGGNRTLANPSNVTSDKVGQVGSIFVVQDETGGRTLSFGSNWDFINGTAPTLSSSASAVDRIDYIVRSTTSIHAVLTKGYS
jgi:hypothetical protein